MHNGKVAVIGADEKFLGEIEEVLRLGGYTPIVHSDALVAVDSVVEHMPAVVLLGTRMQGKNGPELARVLNRMFKMSKIPVIGMSDFRGDEVGLSLGGIKRWLRKPFQPLDVFWAIENEIACGLQ